MVYERNYQFNGRASSSKNKNTMRLKDYNSRLLDAPKYPH